MLSSFKSQRFGDVVLLVIILFLSSFHPCRFLIYQSLIAEARDGEVNTTRSKSHLAIKGRGPGAEEAFIKAG